MILIIGGQKQGKLSFAAGKYELSACDICDCAHADFHEISQSRCVYRLHEYVKRLVRNSSDKAEKGTELSSIENSDIQAAFGENFDDADFWDELISCFREDAVIICDEVGLGVVPADKEERIYRQAVGRLCCRLAERADCVERVLCGIGMRIK